MLIKLRRFGSLLFGCATHLKLIASVEFLLAFWFGCLICFGLLRYGMILATLVILYILIKLRRFGSLLSGCDTHFRNVSNKKHLLPIHAGSLQIWAESGFLLLYIRISNFQIINHNHSLSIFNAFGGA